MLAFASVENLNGKPGTKLSIKFRSMSWGHLESLKPFCHSSNPLKMVRIYIFKSPIKIQFDFSARIINVSSVAGLYGYPGLSTYCASKHAIEAVSSVLRHELRKFDISVVTVQPGDFSKATHLLDNHHRYVE